MRNIETITEYKERKRKDKNRFLQTLLFAGGVVFISIRACNPQQPKPKGKLQTKETIENLNKSSYLLKKPYKTQNDYENNVG